ncbi:uncharacterized protein LOC100897675 [Galendromus occidentalis]|uniref:Uncharacterized protein LOC100897675 n=1 Tax=Galendromus occidentalis TaxID=34638 RepID=A0AAJ6VW70_9ACAR|nr:uncharacterized protein LOC100897675 [Galendromus occidentalis]
MTPVTVRAKRLFQSLWKRKIDWDDILPEDIRLSYEDFVSTLKRCAEFRINRPLSSLFSTTSFELHTFCDASLEAYGAVIYLRTIGNNSTESRLIISKARVVPTKARWSIHRYELMGALMAARMTANIRNFLKLKIDQEYYWIDNMACVSWIRSTPEKWQPFVANRVREIGKLTSPNSWRYVKSEKNPADILSRETNEERKSQTAICLHTVHNKEDDPIDKLLNPTRFSSWSKFVRAQAFCNQLKTLARKIKSKQLHHRNSTRITTLNRVDGLHIKPSEYEEAERDLMKRIQKRHFPTEVSTSGKEIPKTSTIAQFQPFMDVDGILRTCPGCKRYNAKPAAEPTPPLPAFRVATTPPFLFTGVDFAGPFAYKKENGKRAKAYILLFTCAVSRAIALFLTKDLSTYEVLNALQKFINRYPSAKNFVSDNGASFPCADLEIKLIYNHISRGDISSWLTDSKLTWNFISPAAPWVGGFWERMVGCAKRCLKRTLRTTIPYFGDFEVILSGVEAIINQRPSTTVSPDPNEVRALSPANLYTTTTATHDCQNRKKSRSYGKTSELSFSRNGGISSQKTLSAFWKRFQAEYLANLRTAHSRRPVKQRSLQLGEICILKEENTPRSHWPLVRVVELYKSSADHRNRTCTIKFSNGRTRLRPAKLLYPLEHGAPDPLQ